MEHLTDAVCPTCGNTDSMAMEVNQANHDPQLIDVIVKCCICGSVLNEFLCIDEMSLCGCKENI